MHDAAGRAAADALLAADAEVEFVVGLLPLLRAAANTLVGAAL
jgi:hypothetical protein